MSIYIDLLGTNRRNGWYRLQVGDDADLDLALVLINVVAQTPSGMER